MRDDRIKYRLIGNGDTTNIKKTVLNNRGIENVKEYLHLSESSCHEFTLLDNISEGIELLNTSIKQELPIYIVVDCDCDGYCSASMIFDYIKNGIEYENVFYLLHTGKQHGLSKDIMKQLKENSNLYGVGLVILPDAGTNDEIETNKLKEYGFQFLIIDHHEKEIITDETEKLVEHQNAILINNQMCDYPNKNLCGAGVVYKFLQALDEYYWLDSAEQYIDLVALANIADVMDLRNCETKYLVDNGLRNITHPILKAFIEKQSFSISNKECPTVVDVSFYISPLVNAMIRMGSQEEKELMFKAFIKEYKEFTYLPRKSKKNPEPIEIIESIYDRVARLCGNVKARQSKLQDKAVDEIIEFYDNNNVINSVCFINATKLDYVPKELTGLIAMKIADKYGKPCLILRKDSAKSTDETIVFSGSARNVHNGIIEDLKQELNDSQLFEVLLGHSNAFGASIKKENIPSAIKYFNEKYHDDISQKLYKVDFVFNENIDYKVIREIYGIKNLFSGFVEEPLVAVKNVYMDSMGLEEFGSNGKQHWKCQVGTIEYIKFNASDDDKVLNIMREREVSHIIINVVGKTAINTFGGKTTPQIIIENYDLVTFM